MRYEPLVEVWTGKVKGLGMGFFDRGFSRINADEVKVKGLGQGIRSRD